MKAYFYNKENFHYVTDYDCQLDPVESKIQNKDIYLLPADATFIKPDDFDIENQYAEWNESEQKWYIKDIEKVEEDIDDIEDNVLFLNENTSNFLSSAMIEGINNI